MKAHELARELNISHKELLNYLQQNRLTRNPSAPLPPQAVEAARGQFARTTTARQPQFNGDRKVALPPTISVQDLAERLQISHAEVIKKLMQSNIMATKNQVIDYGTAEIVADDFGFKVEPIASEDVVAVESGQEGGVVTTSRSELFSLAREDPAKLRQRPPIVTVLGHVDHGKTSILDAIRKTHVARGEAGGITQRIGAYQVQTSDGDTVVFIDTPGHEAFTAMRARGASVTDVVVLVVAADDGVMPQTVEAINHAKAAPHVKIMVAINKIDLASANIDRVKKQLQERELTPEDWGGEAITVPVSATRGTNIDQLLEMMTLQAEVMELKASPTAKPRGTVIEARVEAGRGPTATVIVQMGTLRVGDAFICGDYSGKVKSLIDDRGQPVKSAGPSTPVKVLGFTGLPNAGDELLVMDSEREAKQLSEERQESKRAGKLATPQRATLETLLEAADGKKVLH